MDKNEIVSSMTFSSPTMKFRLATSQDIDFMLQQERIYEKYVGQWTRKQHQAALTDPDIAQLIFYDDDDQAGYLILKGLQHHARSLELYRITATVPGKGYGRAMIESVKRLTFEILKFHRLWLDVVDYNTRAFSIYKHLGFVLEGTLRDADYYKGKYNSMHILSILEEEYIL